jgi:3-methyladenine DNA glycosylase/8-oxoguanine DNA glycosylase
LTLVAEIPLVGAGGEPVDFARTIVSHGVAELAPNSIDLDARTLETTLHVPDGARSVRLSENDGKLRIDAVAGRIGARAGAALATTVAHMFRLDEDISGFYAVVSEDGDLSWCARGAGRMLRAPTVFEDVVKTSCTLVRTTNPGIGNDHEAQESLPAAPVALLRPA